MKILVVGHSSSGKSTFAKRLGEHYHLPVLHIDKVYFGPNWSRREQHEVEAEIVNFMNQDDWIIDGLYRKYATERFDLSDQLFIFDFNRFKCLYGAIIRRIKYHNKNRDTIADGCKERLNLSFILWILFNGRTKKSRDLLKHYKEKYKDKVVVFKNRKQINTYLLSIGYKGSFKYE
ncbi:MAG: DNA topology modulation protein FlaR [Tenericutes bacterium HGW-Tenericutes-3]|nr:MAG: DNA topology modulation protein FlaR [Tenericutes bacterium HGW-Tenericutes-3]